MLGPHQRFRKASPGGSSSESGEVGMADVRDAPLRSHDAMQVPGRNGMDSVIYARRGRSQGHVQPHHRHTIIAIYGMLYPCPKLPPVANRTGIKNGQDDLVTLLM